MELHGSMRTSNSSVLSFFLQRLPSIPEDEEVYFVNNAWDNEFRLLESLSQKMPETSSHDTEFEMEEDWESCAQDIDWDRLKEIAELDLVELRKHRPALRRGDFHDR